jgi:integrase/recombinase XerD
MTAMAGAVEDYLAIRRALGHKLLAEGAQLAEFARYASARGQDTVRIETAISWASAATEPRQVARRLSILRAFATYLAAFDPTTQIPPQRMLAAGVIRRAPYIFSDTEVDALITAARSLSPPLRGLSYATLIALMAATGLRTGEAVRLDRSDVDLTDGLLLIRYTKYGKHRRIPIDPTAVTALAEFADRRDLLCPAPVDAAFLLNRHGQRLAHVGDTFHGLLTTVGINAAPGRRAPRLHDLRHTFAVTTVRRWHTDGTDVQSRLPLLSVYLGHVNPAHTYWYLQAVPELMTVLADRLDDVLGDIS